MARKKPVNKKLIAGIAVAVVLIGGGVALASHKPSPKPIEPSKDKPTGGGGGGVVTPTYTGTCTKKAQQYLRDNNYTDKNGNPIAVDGAWGPLTDSAYNKFLADKNLVGKQPVLTSYADSEICKVWDFIQKSTGTPDSGGSGGGSQDLSICFTCSDLYAELTQTSGFNGDDLLSFFATNFTSKASLDSYKTLWKNWVQTKGITDRSPDLATALSQSLHYGVFGDNALQYLKTNWLNAAAYGLAGIDTEVYFKPVELLPHQIKYTPFNSFGQLLAVKSLDVYQYPDSTKKEAHIEPSQNNYVALGKLTKVMDNWLQFQTVSGYLRYIPNHSDTYKLS